MLSFAGSLDSFSLTSSSVSWTSAEEECSKLSKSFGRIESSEFLKKASNALVEINATTAWVGMHKNAKIELCSFLESDEDIFKAMMWVTGSPNVTLLPVTGKDLNFYTCRWSCMQIKVERELVIDERVCSSNMKVLCFKSECFFRLSFFHSIA